VMLSQPTAPCGPRGTLLERSTSHIQRICGSLLRVELICICESWKGMGFYGKLEEMG